LLEADLPFRNQRMASGNNERQDYEQDSLWLSGGVFVPH
jgi:hypothetical protein